MRQGFPPVGRFTVITGHYGCGKTTLAVNLAIDLRRVYESVMLVDLDVVNPYFRSSDHRAMLEGHGVDLIAPTFAGTTLDTPSLPPEVDAVFETQGAVVIDAGGDDAGATVLGRYAEKIAAVEHEMLYVINRYRPLIASPEQAAQLLAHIEAASHLKATGVVNNSHLRDETTLHTVLDSMGYARQTASLLGLPLRFTTVPERVYAESRGHAGAAGYVENAYPIRIHVRAPWEERS